MLHAASRWLWLLMIGGPHLGAQAATARPAWGGLVATGGQHTCAITRQGAVKCWGKNDFGQVGDGTTRSSATPVQVVGLSAGVIAIAAGDQHSCALLASGKVKCWGQNRNGQIGDGTAMNDKLTPFEVSDLSGVKALAAGLDHTCALLSNGGVKCWGGAASLGVGTGVLEHPLSAVPLDVPGLESGVRAIAANGHRTCVLLSTGGVKYWGETTASPLDLAGVTSAKAVSVSGSDICALLANGGVKCWNDRDERLADFQGLTSGVVAIAGGGSTCALLTTGAVKCHDWRGTVEMADLPRGLTGIALGGAHACASSEAGVLCWGSDEDGQLGDGVGASVTMPVAVAGLEPDVVAVAAGGRHACALLSHGGVMCWGEGSSSHMPPTGVPGLGPGVSAITAGGAQFDCALVAGGAKCWGRNFSGALGDGTAQDRAAPAYVPGLTSGVRAVAAGVYHACAVLDTGGVKCWGDHGSGSQGDGATDPGGGPRMSGAVDVLGLTSGVGAIVPAAWHTCAVLSTGRLKCWGNNQFGQLGTGSTARHAWAPVVVAGLGASVVSATAAERYTCAVLATGKARCWGTNEHGQLGDGGKVLISRTPVNVVGLTSGVKALAAGRRHACALLDTGGVKCWGRNDRGQVGDGTLQKRAVPNDVAGLASRAVAIAAGDDFTCALLDGGTVKCWGDDLLGQVSGVPPDEPHPVVGL